MRLKEYEIAEENEVLLWKFSTTKKAKCDGQHCTRPGELGTYMWVSAVRSSTNGCDGHAFRKTCVSLM